MFYTTTLPLLMVHFKPHMCHTCVTLGVTVEILEKRLYNEAMKIDWIDPGLLAVSKMKSVKSAESVSHYGNF
jgi:hypothetical protein